jgi:hypothetical protein
VIRTLLALLVVLAACTPAASSPTTRPTASPTAEATQSPSAEPTAEASPDSTPAATDWSFGEFNVAAHPEADALFAETFDCQNIDDGYQVDFPAEWNTNAELGNVPPCSYFAAVEYEMDDPNTVPDEVSILIFRIPGGRDYGTADISTREEGFVGVTQPAFRVEGSSEGESFYEYVIQLGPTPEGGPNLIATTSTARGGDFELNKAVLDRMMATMELIGTIE